MVKVRRPTLLVQNDASSRRALSKLLSSLGHKVVAVGALKDAQQAMSTDPEVVILDLVLPDGNGVEILRRIRREGGKTVVAVVSGGNDDTLSEAISLRPNALFGKPVDIEDFRNWLTETQKADAC